VFAVSEQTQPILLRKTSRVLAVMGLVLQEAVLVTAVAGYLGLVAGVALLETMSGGLSKSDFFKNPEVDFGVAVSATVLLVFAGAVAGFFPARRAAAIRPVEALRDE